jgi:hypothetical protein
MADVEPVRVVRREDLVDLRFDLRGLELRRNIPVQQGELVRPDDATGAGLLLVKFGPQHVIEETYKESSRTT